MESSSGSRDSDRRNLGHDFSHIPLHPKTPVRLQTKLAVNAPGDVFEQEADAFADKVMRMGTPPAEAVRHRSEAGKVAQRKTRDDADLQTAPPIVDELLRSPGRPLDAGTREFMEPRFGHDFSRVQVHSGAAAAQSARDLSASAYTVGHHIVFDSGRFVPGTDEGRRLLAHELTHVVQQTSLDGGGATAGRTLSTPKVQRQVPFVEPWARPVPLPRIGPIPNIGPMPDVRPMPPVIPMPGNFDFEPELEIEDIPDNEELEEPGGSPDQKPEPDAEPAAEPAPQPGPAPVPPIVPNPAPDDKKDDDQNFCGSKRMPLTQVSSSTGPFGQGGTVRASPLTRCPGNTIGSVAKASTYPDQFRCIKKAGLSRTWLPLHLLHGPSPRPHTRLRNLHGPGNERWNIIIGDTTLNGKMYHAVEDLVINRVYDWNQVLWLESKVVEYFPGAEFFAKKVSLAWGLFDTRSNTETNTIGGGTFESEKTPPACPSTSRAGAPAVTPNAASGFDTTISICHTTLKSKTPFPVTSGGLELKLRARAQGQNCNINDYVVELFKFNKNWIDGAFGRKTVPAGKSVKLRWANLPTGDYYFVFTVGPHDPTCCLKGDMSVRTFFAQAGGGIIA